MFSSFCLELEGEGLFSKALGTFLGGTSALREVFRNPSHLLVVLTPSSCRELCLTLAQDRTSVSRE